MNSKTTEIQFRALKEGEVGTETAIELISRDENNVTEEWQKAQSR
jgi:hypothetical protein